MALGAADSSPLVSLSSSPHRFPLFIAASTLSSLLLIGVAEAVGLAPILAGYALLSCACMLIFALKLPEVGARFKQSASAQAHVDAEQGGARRAPLLPEERPSTAYGSATSINVGDVPPSGDISTASALWPLKRDEHCQWR